MADNGQALRYINPAQVGGIETSVLDDGLGRSTRIAWVNTGSGLRYKVNIDRGLDIAEAFFNAHSLAWLSYGGTTAPQRAYDHPGMEWLRSFPGGLVTSCGPLNAGAPCTDEGAELGLHGYHSNTPASVESVNHPAPARGRMGFSITGIVRTPRVFGPNLELRRTIEGELGQPVIHIRDEFINRGNAPAPHAWLLHINLGWPLLDEGARIVYRGTLTPRGDKDSLAWFEEGRNPQTTVPAPLDIHRGPGEACAYIDPQTDDTGRVHVGLLNEKLQLGLTVSFSKREFPRWANWQHYGPGGEYVIGIEPCNCGVEGRCVDRERGWLDMLEPGETRLYVCSLRVLTGQKALADFAAQHGPK